MTFVFRGYVCFIFLLLINLAITSTAVIAEESRDQPPEQQRGSAQMIIGIASSESSTAITSEAAHKLSNYLAKQLSFPVKAKVFETEKQLLEWMQLFREVDLAWLPDSTLKSIPIGELHTLARSQKNTAHAQGGIVAHQGMTSDRREQISLILISMVETQPGQETLDLLGVGRFEKPSAAKGVPTRVFDAKGLPQSVQTPEKEQTTVRTGMERNKQTTPEQESRTENHKRPTPPPVSRQKTAAIKPAEKNLGTRISEQLVIGFAADSKGLKKSKESTKQISRYLQEQLSMPVEARRFDTEDNLYRWLTQFREVDIAWLSSDYLKNVSVGELVMLVFEQNPAQKAPTGMMVSHQGLDSSLQQKVSDVLVAFDQTAQGKESLKKLGITHFSAPAADKAVKASKAIKVSKQQKALSQQRNNSTDLEAPQLQKAVSEAIPGKQNVTTRQAAKTTETPQQQRADKSIIVPSETIVSAAKRKEQPPSPQYAVKKQQLVVGVATGTGSMRVSDKAKESLKRYLQRKLSMPIKVRSFDTEEALHRWLFQFREVDIALLSADKINAQPVGELAKLAQSEESLKDNSHGMFVSHLGLDISLQERISRALQEMQEEQAGREALLAMEVKQFLPPAPTRGKVNAKQPETTAVIASILPDQKQKSVEAETIESQKGPEPEGTEANRIGAVSQTLPAVSSANTTENVPPQPSKRPEAQEAQISLPAQTEGPENPGTINLEANDQVAAQTKQSLGKLFGTNEVLIPAIADGRYIENMAKVQTFEGEKTGPIPTTNLYESIRAGRSFSRDSLAALERTEQAKAQTGQAFGLLMPSVAVRVSSGKETSEPSVVIDEDTGELIGSDTHTRTDASLTVRQPLFDLPRYLDWRRRKETERARNESYRISDGDAYISTVNAYLSLVSSRLQADVTRSFEDQLAELLEYIEKRASAGAASVSDMARVRARIQATLSSRLEQESAHAAAGIEFVRLTNVAPKKVRMPNLEDIGESTLPASFDVAVEQAMEANPEVAALTAELKAAKIDMNASKSRYLPRLNAEYTDTYTDGAGGSADDQRDKRLMAVLNWELFSGGKDFQHNLERTARYKELQYRLDDQRRRVVQNLSANYTALKTTRERLDTSYAELESISTAAEAMSKRMLSGNQSLLDLLDVYDSYYQVRARLVNLHTLEMNTIAELIRTTRGAPWETSALN